MMNVPWDNNHYLPNRLLQAEFIPAKSSVYPDRPQSPSLKDATTSTQSTNSAPAAKPAGRYIPPSARNRAGRGGSSLAERMRAEKEGKLVGARKVTEKPKVVGVTGKVVVGMAPPTQGKSKSALRREKAKKKKEEEEARQAMEAKALAEQEAAKTTAEPIDPQKRARKIKKTLKQIDELKKKDASARNDDQKKKIESEQSLLDELAKLEI